MPGLDDLILTKLFMWKKFDAKKNLNIAKEIIVKRASKKAILFFPYWTGKSHIYHGLAQKFNEYTLVFYDYPNQIMSSNLLVSKKYFREILIDAFNLILDFRKKGYNEIILVGSSLGSNISLKLATMVKVDKIVLNMIDKNLALEVFSSPAMSGLRKKLETKGVKYSDLDKIYSFISPQYSLPLLGKTNTKLLIFLSKNDIFCTLDQFSPLIKKLDELKISYRLRINTFLGHILSIYKNLFFSGEIVKFVKES